MSPHAEGSRASHKRGPSSTERGSTQRSCGAALARVRPWPGIGAAKSLRATRQSWLVPSRRPTRSPFCGGVEQSLCYRERRVLTSVHRRASSRGGGCQAEVATVKPRWRASSRGGERQVEVASVKTRWRLSSRGGLLYPISPRAQAPSFVLFLVCSSGERARRVLGHKHKKRRKQ